MLLVPTYIFAANAPRDFKGVVNLIIGFVNLLMPLIVTLTMVVFFWGVIKAWILGEGDVKSIESGKNIALAGIVAFVLMTTIWGVIALLRKSFFGT